MELTKETLKNWLQEHSAISQREMAREAGLHTEAIMHLYNAKNRNLTPAMAEKLLPVLQKYGWG
jgi:plasmid maintenance system antidote protein VapI